MNSTDPERITCPGCKQYLYPGETCVICAAVQRMRARWYALKGYGKFISKSQPQEK